MFPTVKMTWLPENKNLLRFFSFCSLFGKSGAQKRQCAASPGHGEPDSFACPEYGFRAAITSALPSLMQY